MAITIPTSPVAVEKVEPVVLIMYGATKVGKTALLADLPDNMILDLERGAETYQCLRVRIDTYADFIEATKQLADTKLNPRHKYLTVDTIDRLVEWLEQDAVATWNDDQKKVKDPQPVRVYSEIPYGKGYDLVRIFMRKWMNHLKKIADHVILVGHLKRTIIGETRVEVKEDNLDLVGKLRSLVCADADAVAFAYRDKTADGKPALKFSFRASENTAAGSRLPNLKGKIFDMSIFDPETNQYTSHWENIYPYEQKENNGQ